MKKILLIFLIICISAAGCSKNNDNSGSDIDIEYNKNKVNDNNSQDANADDSKNNSKDNVQYTEDEADSVQDNVNNPTDSNISNDNSTLNVSKNEEIEKFDEILIPFDERIKQNNERHRTTLLNADNQIEVYTLSPDSSSFIWKYTLSDSGWDREAAVWLDGLKNKIDQNRIYILLGEDGNYYAVYVTSDEMSHIVKKNGSTYEAIAINHWEDNSKGYYMIPDQIAVLENGNIVMASRTRRCFIYDKDDGSTLAEFDCGWYTSMSVSNNNIIVLDKENKSIIVYDSEQMKISSTLEGNFGVNALSCNGDDTIYVCNTSGFYKLSPNKTEFIRFMRGGVTMLTDDQLTRLKWFAADDLYYVIYADDREKIIMYRPTDPNAAPKEQLVIYALKANKAIRSAITQFKLRFPDIEIVYETGDNLAGASTVSDSIRALNIEILSGTGPDIIIMDGLSADTYIEKGILMNLNELVNEKKDELLESVVSAYSKAGDIYMLPIRVGLPMFFTADECKDAVSSFNTLVEYSENNGGCLLGDITYDEIFDYMYQYYFSDFITDKKSIDKEKLQEYLTLLKRFIDSEDVREQPQTIYGYISKGSGYDLSMGIDRIYITKLKGIIGAATLPDVISQINGAMIPVENKFEPMGIIGINNNSKKKDLAISFIKTALLEEVQEIDTDCGFPVNVSALNTLSGKDFSYMQTAMGDRADRITFSARWASESEAKELVNYVKNANIPWDYDEVIKGIIHDEAMPYLKDVKALDNVVNAIMSRVELYQLE